ncbi:RAQPRD family integrative conjugative element protein [Pseudomonas sp. PS01300]|uniref:integrative conjugative element protein, RAQPRD family n=1 Tax=Pseudomonas sp. PS01300 TaxID=2991436 RepID=UPI00249B4106|nr:RAQPRD family integrative conjugative element protein [Pseudomonas sp. PS01300]
MKSNPYLPIIAVFLTFNASAQALREHSDLQLLQQQVIVTQKLAERAARAQSHIDENRYRFNYLRFDADLKRVRQGIHNYLAPSRAQPADLVELSGDYRTEALHSSPSNEHD